MYTTEVLGSACKQLGRTLGTVAWVALNWNISTYGFNPELLVGQLFRDQGKICCVLGPLLSRALSVKEVSLNEKHTGYF